MILRGQVAELVKYVIYGCIAGVMSSIMLTARGNDSDNQQRMRAIRDWCKDKRIPAEMRYEVREGPSSAHCSLSSLPPSFVRGVSALRQRFVVFRRSFATSRWWRPASHSRSGW